jgi:hypothetical protein
VRSFSSQEFDVTTYWDLKEALATANLIADILTRAGWKYIKPAQDSFLLGGVGGVEVWVHPAASEQVRKAADSLVAALTAVGLDSILKLTEPQKPRR